MFLLGTVCLYPSLHEVLFIDLCMSWGLGTVFMMLNLRSESFLAKAVFAFLSFACLDSYVFPLLLFPLLQWLLARSLNEL